MKDQEGVTADGENRVLPGCDMPPPTKGVFSL